jgi:hypothetical protein
MAPAATGPLLVSGVLACAVGTSAPPSSVIRASKQQRWAE